MTIMNPFLPPGFHDRYQLRTGSRYSTVFSRATGRKLAVGADDSVMLHVGADGARARFKIADLVEASAKPGLSDEHEAYENDEQYEQDEQTDDEIVPQRSTMTTVTYVYTMVTRVMAISLLAAVAATLIVLPAEVRIFHTDRIIAAAASLVNFPGFPK